MAAACHPARVVTLLISDVAGDEQRAPLLHAEIYRALETGAELLIDDGRMHMPRIAQLTI